MTIVHSAVTIIKTKIITLRNKLFIIHKEKYISRRQTSRRHKIEIPQIFAVLRDGHKHDNAFCRVTHH